MLKSKSKIHQYLIIALLALFALGQVASIVHGFSHHLDGKIIKKIVLDKSSKKEQKHNIIDCTLCSAFSFSTNGMLFNLASFSLLCFLILTIFLVENNQKLLAFKASNPSRAPPYFS